MIVRSRDRSGGFSLVELLVVMAIVAILMGISIPILQMFSQNEMDRGARSLYTMVRAARVYAQTFNVKTAVVYQLDQDPAANPVMDSLRKQAVRVLRGATVLYQLPANMGSYKGLWVPEPNYGYEFEPFSLGYAVLLDVPPPAASMPPTGPAYTYGLSTDPADDNANFLRAFGAGIGSLGMEMVKKYDAPIDPDPAVREQQFDAGAIVLLLAHVFDTGGKLEVGGDATTQRFSILFAPSPDRPANERTWSTVDVNDITVSAWRTQTPPVPDMGLIGIPIEIYRSTGRVRMGSL